MYSSSFYGQRSDCKNRFSSGAKNKFPYTVLELVTPVVEEESLKKLTQVEDLYFLVIGIIWYLRKPCLLKKYNLY